jgi:DNA-binding transcriptional regulator YdaS (Cro superfamily)
MEIFFDRHRLTSTLFLEYKVLMNKTPLHVAVEFAGGQSALARMIGVRQGYIWKWLQSGRTSPKYCLAIERVTFGKVTRYQLRPDVFGASA